MYKLKYAPSIESCLRPLNLTFETLWEAKAETEVTEHRTSDVMRIRIPAAEKGRDFITVYRKRYWYPSLRERVKGFFRNTFVGPSRAAAEFAHLLRLDEADLSLVKPVAYGEDRCCRLLKRAFIITSHIPETASLEDHVKMKSFQDLLPRDRRTFLCSLGRWVASLHDRGIRDKDLYARNILVHPVNREWRFSKIDSPVASGGTKPPGTGSPYLKDLRDLDSDLCGILSRQDRLRCLLAYRGSGRVDREIRRRVEEIV